MVSVYKVNGWDGQAAARVEDQGRGNGRDGEKKCMWNILLTPNQQDRQDIHRMLRMGLMYLSVYSCYLKMEYLKTAQVHDHGAGRLTVW